ncbi:hypothetical protein [Arthrobacter sp. NPDC092385]|uniref:hypothetical protein n=1 Tax=Arthrobacter sp. NPDC092385 TaxID=3363943 RepID=UPI00381D631D
MRSIAKATAGATLAGALLFSAGVAPASAARPIQIQDGLVNVAVGDVTILEDVNIGVAAQVVAQICGVSVGPVAVLGQAVDRSGDTSTVCTADLGEIRLEQN